MKVYGVQHVSRDEKSGKPSGNIDAIIRQLKKDNVRRAGIETGTDSPIMEWNAPPQVMNAFRFVKAVHLRARRRGIELVPLQDGKSAYAIALLMEMARMADSLGVSKVSQWEHFIEANRQQFQHLPHSRTLHTLMEEVSRGFRGKDFDGIGLFHALAASSSYRMYEKAKSLQLEHNIVGIRHMEDMKREFDVKGIYVGQFRPKIPHSLVYPLRKEAFTRYRLLVNRLWEIAEKETASSS